MALRFCSKRVRLPVCSQSLKHFLPQPANHRTFHASPRPQFLEAAISSTHSILDGLHSTTGLPWVYTLPLAALAVRTAIVLPMTIYSRKVIQKQVELNPLISAWQHQIRKETMKDAVELGPDRVQLAVLKKLRKKTMELYTRWNCKRWKTFLPFMQLPIWLIIVETIRRMCGTHKGLLGWLDMTIFSKSESAELSTSTVSTLSPTAILGIEESLSTEGALWFSNLLLPDPQLILPFVLSGALFLNISGNVKLENQTKFQRRLNNTLKVLALAVGPLTLQVPSAILVYWISSSSLAYMQGVAVDKLMPIKQRTLAGKASYLKAKNLLQG